MKIKFALLNQINDRSQGYQDHVRAITDFAVSMQLTMRNIPIDELIVGNTIDSIIDAARSLDGDYLYIVAYGYRSYDVFLVDAMIKYAEDNNYSVLAHILEDNPENKEQGFYSLHNQCALINLNHWRHVGSPSWGNHTNVDNVTLPLVNRSTEDFHDGYTPFYILPTTETRQYTGPVREGWNLASTLLSHGFSIGNFSEELRKFKMHFYPEVGTDLEKILDGNSTIEPVEPNQRDYVRLTDFSGFQGSVYVFNTDSMNRDYIAYDKSTKLDNLYCVAAGFKPIQFLDQCKWDSTTRVIYFDYSDSALAFKEWLLKNWDGRNYLDIIQHYIAHVDPTFSPIWFGKKEYTDQWEKTMDVFGGEAAWLDLWNRYRALEHRFLKINLYYERSELIADMNQHQGNNLIWFSNSFYTEASLRHFKPAWLKSVYDTFINELKLNNTSLQICGTTSTGTPGWTHIGNVIK